MPYIELLYFIAFCAGIAVGYARGYDAGYAKGFQVAKHQYNRYPKRAYTVPPEKDNINYP